MLNPKIHNTDKPDAQETIIAGLIIIFINIFSITLKTLEELPSKGKKNVLMICPGFSSDCVETLEEIAIQGKESFIENGGENYDIVPCLNDNEDHIKMMEYIVKKYLIN